MSVFVKPFAETLVLSIRDTFYKEVFVSVKDVIWHLKHVIRDHHKMITLGVCVGERLYMASDNQRSSRVKHSVFVSVKDFIWRLTIRDHHE